MAAISISRQNKFFLLLVTLFVTTIKTVPAQPEDFQSWGMLSVSKELNANYATSLTSIFRFNDTSSRFSDINFDYRLTRKLKKGFEAQIIFRNWTFIEREPVYFLWYDFKHVLKQSQHKWVNLIRLHHGLDWVGKEQADFIRWRSHYYHTLKSSNFQPFVGCDFWFRFNNRNNFQQIWMEAGTEYFHKNLKLRLNYRRIQPFTNQPGWRRNIIVVGLFFSL